MKKKRRASGSGKARDPMKKLVVAEATDEAAAGAGGAGKEAMDATPTGEVAEEEEEGAAKGKVAGDARRSVGLLEDMLTWRHCAPTAPDTMDIYPFFTIDPFVMEHAPSFFFAGNQPEFGTSLVDGPDGHKVCVGGGGGPVVVEGVVVLAGRRATISSPGLARSSAMIQQKRHEKIHRP